MLKWDPERFGGIHQVRVPVGKIWKPDIVLYNYADERLKEHRDAMAVIESDGKVVWLPAAIFKSTCSIDIIYFPFDIQLCKLKFGSWTYDGFKLDLNFYEEYGEQMDITDYVKSNEWKLLSRRGRKNKIVYPCCPEPYYDLTFELRIKRIPIFYTFTLIIPCVLLSLLTLVSFWLPPETPAKILLGAYFCLNMVLITLSSFISASVINLYRRDDKKNKVPEWLRKVAIDGLSRILCMEQRKGVIRKKTRRDHVTHHVTHVIDGTMDGRKSHHEKTIKSPVLPYNKWEAPPPSSAVTMATNQGGHVDSPIASHPTSMAGHCFKSYISTAAASTADVFGRPDLQGCPIGGVLEVEVKEIKRVLKNFMTKLQMRDMKERSAMEWRLVALSIDRLFFALYVITIIVSTLTIYLMCFIYYESAENIE